MPHQANTSDSAQPEWSEFGQRLCCGSGIGELMDDLGHALAAGGDKMHMLGGGQPAHIPEMDALWRKRIEEITATPGELEHMLGNYEPPAGCTRFRQAIADLFHKEFGWELSADHVAITMGGQSAFFCLFNALGGRFADGQQKKILLPLVPEYIGYADQSVGGSLFRSVKPRIEYTGEHEFKYCVDFDNLEVTEDIAAICVSRPTNPTGNVLTDNEIAQLAQLAEENGIPLIIDNAYGAPFPNVIFTEATPIWNDNIILTLSLSKLGLPGTRTGIVIARPEVIKAVASMTSIMGLANTNTGQAIAQPLIESGEILRLSNELVQPFYRGKSVQAQAWVKQYFDPALDYYIHRSEGALFLWAWFKGLPITSRELYERLKARNVLVVPGSYFFFGQDDSDWKHREECIRINFTMPEEDVQAGIRIIGEEVSKAYAKGAQIPPQLD
jgi:valine--pyruvate aminotransferase